MREGQKKRRIYDESGLLHVFTSIVLFCKRYEVIFETLQGEKILNHFILIIYTDVGPVVWLMSYDGL